MVKSLKKRRIKKHHIAISTVILVVIVAVIVIGNFTSGPFPSEPETAASYQFDRENNVVLYPFSPQHSDTITMGAIVLAQEETDDLLISNKTFDQGDTLYFILANATGFSVQLDGYSWYDVDVDIIKNGVSILSETNTLGESGKLFLKSPVVTPFGTIDVPSGAEPGEYDLQVSLYDMYTGESVFRTTGFTVLE